MVSRENTNWLFDYGLIDDIPVPDATFGVNSSAFTWPPNALDAPSNVGVDIDGSLGDSDGLKESGSKKRFVELGSILEPGRPAKTDKTAILIDAVRMVTQLRGEAQKLKDTNQGLQEKIKDLKAEKNELRDQKQRLKAEKEKLEQQLKSLNGQPSFMPPPAAIPAAFAVQGQAHGNKLVPFISYPGVAMWQFMPPAAVDTSQDHVLRPPVA
uniref:BHLH domain-containing protein n=1 Tax=Glycine max TaxID=3847 RepID=I1LSN7_SOYBN